MRKNIFILTVISLLLLISPVLAMSGNFYPTSGTDTTSTFSYTLTPSDLTKLVSSDNIRYISKGVWANPFYEDGKYIELVFSPSLPYNASTICGATLTFEWQRDQSWIQAARIFMWDQSSSSWQTQDFSPMPDFGVDKTETVDMSSFINTKDDVNNFKLRFQAMGSSCINDVYSKHDLVKIDICYEMTPCSSYGNSGSCEADPNCDWCSQCSGNLYSGGSDRCVNTGTCNYLCEFSPTPFCGATCEQNSDCQSYCNGNTRYFNGNCNSGCQCTFSSENCDSQDKWYNTTTKQWISTGQCTEKEQLQQEYRDYSCAPSGCTYTITNSQWVDTGNTRNKNDGTSCDDGLFCTNPDTCQAGVCQGPARNCADSIACTVDSCDEALDQCVHTANNTFCNDQNVCTDDICSLTQDCTHTNNANSCDDGLWCTINDQCSQGACSGIARDCSGNNILGIATCLNSPDSNAFTWDFRNSFTSVCNEATDSCTTGNQTITHTCSVANCSAQCDATHSCTDKCVDGVRYYSGSCLASCSCSYSQENCGALTGCYVYQTGCEDRTYTCAPSGCQYTFSNRNTDFNESSVQYCLNNQLRQHKQSHDFYCNGACSDHISFADDQLIQDCGSQSGWYNTTTTQWVAICQCVEKEQQIEEYRTYSCSPSGCYYNITNTAWIDTGATRNKPNGTPCNDGLFCTDGDSCSAGTCYGGPRDCHENPDILCTLDSCDEVNDKCVHTADNSYCNDQLYCNGQEFCNVTSGCQSGPPVNCSANNILSIATCLNNPDNNPFTYDYRNPFTSLCVEDGDNQGHCTTGNNTITHFCSVANCSAQCDATHSCANNSCSQTYTDYCNGKKLVEYNSNKILDSTTISNSCSNTCNLESCLCSNCQVSCPAPQTNTYCVFNVCGAECDAQNPCQNKCVDGIRYYNGVCQGDCSCSYSTQNCNSQDNWYNTTTKQWISTGQCTEKEQLQQQYRDYSCDPAGCTFSVMSTQWIDTGATRNKPNGTPCNDGLSCTTNDTCTDGICSGTINDILTPQVLYVFSGNDWIGYGDTFYVDSKIIDDTADCIAPRCLVKITDNQDKTAYIDSHLQYDAEIQKCRGYVTVNDTFHESSAWLIIDVWDAANHYNTSRTLVGIDNSKIIEITGVNTSQWYKGGDWLNGVTATTSGTFGSIERCFVDISGISPENTVIPLGNNCMGNIKIPSDISDGPKKLTIKAVNINGRIVNDSVNIQVDNSPPTKNIISPKNDTSYGSQIPVVVSINDQSSGSKNGTYRIVQDPWKLFGFIPIPGTDYDSGWISLVFNGTTWNSNFDTSPLSSGRTYYLAVNVCDNAGNCVDPVIKFSIDKTPPTFPGGLTVTYSPYDKDGDVGLSWPAANDESGINHYNVFVYGSTGIQLFSYTTTQTSYQLINLTDGFYSFNITAVDKAQPAGNENSGITGSTTVDRTCAVDGSCTQSSGGGSSGGSGGSSGGGGGSSGGAVSSSGGSVGSYSSGSTSNSQKISTTTTTTAVCGNGICESGEDQANCCSDCNCTSGYECKDNGCVSTASSQSTSLGITGMIVSVFTNQIYISIMILAVGAVVAVIIWKKFTPKSSSGGAKGG
jgi:hypothetical protein